MTQNSTPQLHLAPSFRSKTLRIAAGIVFFFTVYLISLTISVVALFYSIYYTSMLVESATNLLTIFIFIGANGFLLIVIFFLVKIFIPNGRSSTIKRCELEIDEATQPRLFELINTVADEVKTIRPKKVFLLPDVSASVHHQANLFSLFNSSKQNLSIGLGLIQVMTEQELKAVLAHELAHFSQNVTRVSEFIYRVNKLIIDLLYSDNKWEKSIGESSEWSSIFGFFSEITLAVTSVLKSIFQKLYNIINIEFLSLSRDLEFHADSIAVSITGTDALKNGLYKIELADVAYNRLSEHLDKYFDEGKLLKNLYPAYRWMLEYTGKRNELETENGLPIVTANFYKQIILPRVNFKDQWASHPSLPERVSNIEKSGFSKKYDSKPALRLITNEENIEEQLTRLIYESSGIELAKMDFIIAEEAIDKISETQKALQTHESYNHFYFSRVLDIDIDELVEKYDRKQIENITFQSIYSKENRKKIDRLIQNVNDKYVLESIATKRLKLTWFEFDNVKYKRKESSKLLQQLSHEIEMQSKWLKDLDESAFLFNYALAEKKGEVAQKKLQNSYNINISASKLSGLVTNYLGHYQNQVLTLQNMMNQEAVSNYLRTINNDERKFKKELNSYLQQDFIEQLEEGNNKDFTKNYIEDSSLFFTSQFSINPTDFSSFYNFLQWLSKESNNYYLKTLRNLTDYQLELRNNEQQ
ncbi:MAG: M48 family metallopeptidase [Bacteroidota bacterium]